MPRAVPAPAGMPRWLLVALASMLLAAVLGGCGGGSGGTTLSAAVPTSPETTSAPTTTTAPPARTITSPTTTSPYGTLPSTTPPTTGRPNIVFVLTDDLSLDLLKYMPAVRAMERSGLTFDDYFVSDSLCCPSRASIFTGDFPHDTGVFSNQGPHGGFLAFQHRGDESKSFAPALQRVGYATAMMGKYLNRYMQVRSYPKTYVPAGWSEWDVTGKGYREFDYDLNENGTLVHYGYQPQDYLTDVLAHRGVDFINRESAAGKPFLLELATFAPHSPYVPAPRDRGVFKGVAAPEPPNFDHLPKNPVRWLSGHHPLRRGQIRKINQVFDLRAEDVQSVDEMVARIKEALQDDGVAGNTYLIFSSDNGLHTGEYRLMPGKLTAFDTDIHVPLIVDGPGITANTHTSAMSENIDLAPTFAALARSPFGGDGVSLTSLLTDPGETGWRDAILVEHRGHDVDTNDPDFQPRSAGDPTSYEAIRTHTFLYVEYLDGEREFYDLQKDPYELDNVAGTLTPADDTWLDSEVGGIQNCHAATTCWSAMHLSTPPDALP